MKKLKCKDCSHYRICEYSTVIDKEVDCKDFDCSMGYIKETLKYYLDVNEENGVVYIPKFIVEKIVYGK